MRFRTCNFFQKWRFLHVLGQYLFLTAELTQRHYILANIKSLNNPNDLNLILIALIHKKKEKKGKTERHHVSLAVGNKN